MAQWDDFWIVYRDRAEYAQGRAAWHDEMNSQGRGGNPFAGVSRLAERFIGEKKWPEAVVLPGVATASAAGYDAGKVVIERDIWPREKLVMRQKGSNLGDSLRGKISRWGYEPEDSLGFCPSFANNSIYFAWRKR